MSKITFRADDDLVAAVEAMDASKSEVMREALRAYLEAEGHLEPEGASTDASVGADAEAGPEGSLDALVAERVDELVADRVSALDPGARDVNIDISVEPAGQATVDRDAETAVSDTDGEPVGHVPRPCASCGEGLSEDHVYCPNCGEKAAHRAFCECGEELRSDWAHCPSCGRRTPSADVLGE